MKTIRLSFITGLLLFISTSLLSQFGAPITDFSSSRDTICSGETVQFTDISLNTPTSWAWTFYGGSPATSTLQNPIVVYNLPGKYDVILRASNDKGILSIGILGMVKVMVCSGIGEYEDNFNLQIFPNPAQSYVNVTAKIDAHYTLCNALGSVILKGNVKKDELNKVNIENLATGVYFFSLQQGIRSKSYKLVKE